MMTYLVRLGNNVKDIAEKIRPESMYDIETAVSMFFGEHDYFYEVDVNGRKCDMVFFSNDEIVAIEIKSANDKISRAKEQMPLYFQWANKVYLVYDIKHRKKVEKMQIIEKGVGLLEYKDGDIHLMKEAQLNKPNQKRQLNLMTYDALSRLARKYHVKAKGKKAEIAERVVESLSTDIIRHYFQEYLKSRGCVF
jgi:hypothetical protein